MSLKGIDTDTGSGYTLVASDDRRMRRFTSSSAVTVTVDTDANRSYPANMVAHLLQAGTGTVTVAAASGVTLYGDLSIAQQHAYAAVVRVAANTWHVIQLAGDVTTAGAALLTGATFTGEVVFEQVSAATYDIGNSGTSDVDVDPANGLRQKYTCTGNHTLGGANFAEGDRVELEMIDGDLYTVTLAAELIEPEGQSITYHDRNMFAMYRDAGQIVFKHLWAVGT